MSAADPIRSELREFYEGEAAARSRGPASGRRVEMRSDFIALLRAERRHTVLDIGAGPGTDAHAFTAAGLRYVGLDLATGNARLARDRGHDVVPASLFEPPFRPASFDAGWSMSTLMHVPVDEFHTAMRSALAPLRGGAPFAIGLRGGPEREFRSPPDEHGRRRLFSLRPARMNRAMLAEHGTVEQWQEWAAGPADWEYHACVLRVRD